jgi:formamidopyrimidine-DNA glycosylase
MKGRYIIPELPEVQTIRAGLEDRIVGKTINSVNII